MLDKGEDAPDEDDISEENQYQSQLDYLTTLISFGFPSPLHKDVFHNHTISRILAHKHISQSTILPLQYHPTSRISSRRTVSTRK